MTTACVAACVGMPGLGAASASPPARHDQAIAEFAATLAARDRDREWDRDRQRRRIKGSRISLIAGAGVVVIGAAILASFLGSAARKTDRYDDGNDGFEFLWGAIPIGAGVLAMVVSGPIFVVSRNRLGELGEPQRRILRLRPSLSAGARGGQAGLALDLRF